MISKMPASGKVGAVTVTYNSASVIADFMRSMLAQDHDNFLLYLVDNCSTDATLQRAGEFPDPRMSLIANTKNVGFAEGSNQGIRAAIRDDCDLVLLINNDTEFDATLLSKLVHNLWECGCDMAAPKILYHADRKRIWSAGGGFKSWKGYAGFHFGLNQDDRGQFDTPKLVEHAPACCLLMRKSVFEAIGLMDERLFVYLDDTDFCYRALSAGLKIMYVPGAVVLHKASTLTGGPESEFSVRYRTRNQVYFMLKHLGWRSLLYLPAFQIYQIARYLSGKFAFRSFVARERAFIEGLRVWMESIR